MRNSATANTILAALIVIGALVQLNIASAAYTITGGPGPAPINTTTPNADYAQLDNIMTQFMQNANVPNAQLAVGYGGRILYVRGYTASTAERPLQSITATVNGTPRTYNEPAYVTTQPNTHFRVASLSKLVTGLALQQLVLDGKLAMTDSAYAILRQDASAASQAAFAPAPSDANMLNVTVKHLVNHEAGIARGAPLATPSGQPQDIIDYFDPPGTVKPWPYPYNAATVQEFVKTCKRHLEIDLPRRKLHYPPGNPPQVSGAYYQTYTNHVYCWAERVIEIRSGMAYEDYVRAKVLAPLGVEKPRLANNDVMARWYTGDPANAEINAYYDQPITNNPGATLVSNWCALFEGTPAPPGCVAPRPNSYRAHDYGGAGGWVFSAQEYLRMLQSTKARLRPPYFWTFRRATSAVPTAYLTAPYLPAAPAARTLGPVATASARASTNGASPRPTRSLATYTTHTGSLPGTRSFYTSDDATPMNWVVILNTQPDADYANCSSATTVPDATKYWCLLQGIRVSENNGANITATSTSNSIFSQMRAVYSDAGKRTTMINAADIWVDQTPLPCNLDVNGSGNGVKNGIADGLMILRAMNGARGAGIAGGASGTTSAATTSFDRAEKNARDLVSTKVIDIDGNGVVDPAVDGVILLRAMLGMKDTAVTAGLTIPGLRNNWTAIRNYLNMSCAATIP